VDRASGDVRWRFRAPSGAQIAQGPFKDGVLYASGVPDGIWALRDDGENATVMWHVDATAAHWPMTMVDDTLYEARTDGSVGAYAIADGSMLWETPALGAWADGPIVSGGMMFVGDEAEGIMAFADPSLIAQLPTPVADSSLSPAQGRPARVEGDVADGMSPETSPRQR
jgi:outer membrane protein assembly factor BamB